MEPSELDFLSDRALLGRYGDGEISLGSFLEELARRYSDELRRAIARRFSRDRVDARNVVDELWSDLFLRPPPDPKSIENLYGYLLTCARRIALREPKKRFYSEGLKRLEGRLELAPPTDDVVADVELTTVSASRLFANMPRKQAIALFDLLRGKQPAETALRLSTDRRTVSRWLSSAIALLPRSIELEDPSSLVNLLRSIQVQFDLNAFPSLGARRPDTYRAVLMIKEVSTRTFPPIARVFVPQWNTQDDFFVPLFYFPDDSHPGQPGGLAFIAHVNIDEPRARNLLVGEFESVPDEWLASE